MRLLIVGSLGGQLSTATRIAMDKGASVVHADTIETALRTLRGGRGADLVMADVSLSIGSLIAALEAERIHVPVVACGTSTDAKAAVGPSARAPRSTSRCRRRGDDRGGARRRRRRSARPRGARRGDDGRGPTRRSGGGLRGLDPDHGRERHGQGGARAARPPPLEPGRQAVRLGELRGDPRAASGKRALRSREGRLHGRRRASDREVRGGLRRHAAARRDLRDGRAPAGQAPARHPGTRDRPGGRGQAGAGGHPHHRDVQPQPRRRREGGQLPRGPALPAERREPEDPAAARSPGGRDRARRAFREKVRRRERRSRAQPRDRGQARIDRGALARQRARTREHHAPGDPPVVRHGDRRRRDPLARRPALRGPRGEPTDRHGGPGRPDGGGDDAGAGGAHGGRSGARPHPRHARPLPRQPHPRGPHPRHLHPHAAQQAQRVFGRRIEVPEPGTARVAVA